MRCDVAPLEITVGVEEPDRRFWFLLRSAMVLVILFVFFGLFTDMRIPFLGNFSVREIFWMVLMPVAVMTMYLAPMFWRNVCPLATTSLWYHNLFGKRRLERLGIAANVRTGVLGSMYCFLRSRGLVISAVLFWAIIPYRLVSFNEDSMTSFWLLLSVFGTAAVFGALFPVKSGWCTSLCPVAAAEKAYGMNPAVFVKNTRCHYTDPHLRRVSNCSGCSLNCGDVVESEHAYWAAESNAVFHNAWNARIRKAFVSALPGFVFAYFLLSSRTIEFPYADIREKIVLIYGFFGALMGMSSALYFLVKRVMRHRFGTKGEAYQLGKHRLDLLYVTGAVNVIWFFASEVLVNTFFAQVIGFSGDVGAMIWAAAVFGFFFLSVFGARAGWVERPKTYRTGWW